MDASPQSTSQPNRPRRRAGRVRRWLIRLLVLGLLSTPPLLWAANGPVFRALAEWGALAAARSQGLSGSLDVRGTLWRGFSLEDAHFSSTDSTEAPAEAGIRIHSLTLEQAKVTYRAIPLLLDAPSLRWLDLVRVRHLDLVLELPPAEEGTKPVSNGERSGRAAKSGRYSPVWNLIDRTTIDIDGVRVSVRQGEGTHEIRDFALESMPGRDGVLSVADIVLPGREPFAGQRITLEKGDRELTLGGVRFSNAARLSRLRLAEPEPGVWTAEIEGEIGGGDLHGTLDRDQAIRLTLRDGSRISLEETIRSFSPDLPLTGEIVHLDLHFANVFEPPRQWAIDGSLVGAGIGWQEFRSDSVDLSIRNSEMTLEVVHPEVSGVAGAVWPFSEAASLEDLAALPVEASFRVDAENLGDLVAGFVPDRLPLEGVASLEGKGLRIDPGGDVLAGEITLATEGLTWDGLEVATCRGVAHVEQRNAVKIGFDAGLDPASHLRLRGDFDLDSLRYEGEARVDGKTEGVLGTWLEEKVGGAPSGAITVVWSGAGSLSSPTPAEEPSHRGAAALQLDAFAFPGRAPLAGSARLSYKDARVDLVECRLAGDAFTLSGSGGWDGRTVRLEDWSMSETSGLPVVSLDASLPGDFTSGVGFLDQSGPLSLDLVFEEFDPGTVLSVFHDPVPVSGRADGTWKASGSFRDLSLEGMLSFRPGPSASSGPSETSENALVEWRAGLSGNVNQPSSWETAMDMTFSGFRWNDTHIEDIALTARTSDAGAAKVLEVALRGHQSGSDFSADSRIDLTAADTFEDLRRRPIAIDAAVDAPDLAALWQDWAPPKWRGFPVSGAMSVEVADVRLAEGSLTSGVVDLVSDTLTVEDETWEAVALDARVTRPGWIDAAVTMRADERSHLEASGQFDLESTGYEANVALVVDLASEGRARRLLGNRNIAAFLPRRTKLTAEARGAVRDRSSQGSLHFEASHLSLASGGAPLDSVLLDAEFSLAGGDADPEVAARLDARSAPLDLEGALDWSQGRLVLDDWVGTAGGERVLALSGDLPLEARGLSAAAWFAQENEMKLDLAIDGLGLDTVFRLLGQDAPMRGEVDLSLEAAGSPGTPTLDATLRAGSLAVVGETETEVGKAELTVRAAGTRAELTGTYSHPDVNPLALRAELPFHPRAWAVGERKVIEETLEASARMEASSLAFLPGQVPAIESVEGVAGIDVRVSGTVGKPAISGAGVLDVKRLRLASRDAPSFYDIDLDARFSDNRLQINRLYAIVAGGEIEGSGSVVFPPGGEPRFAIGLRGSDVLLYRNPDLSLRTDVDLGLNGPWSAARISGELGITNSRFFKNFELLPGAIQVRAPSALPTVERTPRGGGAAYIDLNLGVDIAPFRDWTTDIRIHTKDPFHVRSNLVESDLVADLRIGGKLEAPVPLGFVALDEGNLSLPFSSVDVDIGRIEFDEKTGFNGELEFRARARADNYRINIYLYNRVLEPKYVLTSVPPKPSEDLLTLLVTGTTRDELIGEDTGSLAASKAATLLFNNMRKASAEADREPTVLDELQNRTELEIAGVNPETGEHTIGGKVRLWKQLFFVGDVDARSDYRAALMYLFRFR